MAMMRTPDGHGRIGLSRFLAPPVVADHRDAALASRRRSHQDCFVRRLPVDCCTPVAGSSLGDREALELERLLHSLADRHRLRILNMLVRAGAPVCVCEFTAELELPQQNISYHLKQLVDAGVIARQRRGRYSYYALVEGVLNQIAELVAQPGEVAA
jgi:ArsR family transcriptional regulator, arsenate/arsenite/antimonite-responsive transcriptional repressor